MHLCGNIDKYNNLRSWILNRLNSTTKYLSFEDLIFVSGKSGIGKTYNIKLLCEDLDLFVVYLTSNNCSSSTELNDIILKNTTSSLLQLLTNDTKRKIIVIDELETIMSLDRTVNTTLWNMLSSGKIKKIPIICISSSDNMKKMGNIKKKCRILELDEPTEEDISNLLQTIYPNIDNNVIQGIVQNTERNIEQCINKLTTKQCYDSMDESPNILTLYGNTFDRDNIRRIISTDIILVPLKFHENILTELKNRSCKISDRISLYKNFLSNFIIYDMLTNKNNLEVSTDFFISTIYPFTKIKLKKNKNSNIDNFTKILSYQSLQKKNQKKTYSKHFPIYQINNYHINMIGRKYIFFN